MARTPGVGGRTQQINVSEDTSMDRMKARAASKIAPLFPPWICGILTWGVGMAFHAIFGAPDAVPWAAVVLAVGTVVLTILTWNISHYQRHSIGRWHTTATMAATGGWLTIATITGPGQRVTFGALILGGFFFALFWNVRHVIRQKAEDSGVQDPLDKLFGDVFDDHAKGARIKTKAIGEHKAEGELDLQGTGKTKDDVQRRQLAIEGDAGVPPGALTFAQNPDRAGTIDVTITDSRAMKKPMPWPGPYLPGESVGELLQLGMWQDMDPVLYRMTNHHLQIAGKSGAGKTIGGLWSFMAAVIPRTERELWLADITKGKQTWGPIEPALHRLADTPELAKQMVRDLHAEIKKRTNYLGELGLDHWEPGCGIDHLIAWFEEVPDITDILSDKEVELFVSLARTARSAGIFLVLSMQRFDWTVLPTQIRGQMARMTMGVEDSHEAGFALSDRQIAADCAPELWADRQPGMAYIDAPSIPDNRISMPWRTWKIERDELAALAAQYPAQPPRTPDTVQGAADLVAASDAVADAEDVMDDAVKLISEAAKLIRQEQHASTAFIQRKLRVNSEEARAIMRVLQQQGVIQAIEGGNGEPAWKVLKPAPDDVGTTPEDDDDDGLGDVVGEYLDARDDPELADPDPDITAELDDEITIPPEDSFRFQPRDKMTPDAAREALRDQLDAWADEGRKDFATRDLAPLMERTGMSRSWFQKECKALAREGLIERDDDEKRYLLTAPAAV